MDGTNILRLKILQGRLPPVGAGDGDPFYVQYCIRPRLHQHQHQLCLRGGSAELCPEYEKIIRGRQVCSLARIAVCVCVCPLRIDCCLPICVRICIFSSLMARAYACVCVFVRMFVCVLVQVSNAQPIGSVEQTDISDQLPWP